MSDQSQVSLASRKAALSCLRGVLEDGQSLSASAPYFSDLPPRDAAFARLLSYGVLRFYHRLEAILQQLLKKPMKQKDQDIELILVIALYQLLYTRVPDYAVVDVAVKQVPRRKAWASKLVNGVLRNFLRQKDKLLENLKGDEAKYAHPQWITRQLKQDWPDDWQQILEANNQQAPMTLRVNQQKLDTQAYLNELAEVGAKAEVMSLPAALRLHKATDVEQLPGYADGWFSVQDAGAQLAAHLIDPQAGEHILDACAAPGGKTAHMLEVEPSISLTALDISTERLQRVAENCTRLDLCAELVEADASDSTGWWNGELFDRVLLDVPCSAMGVVRRHPDIKHLRRPEDIAALVETQRNILRNSWSLLKPGGTLLYVTCSVFHAENQQQVKWLLSEMEDAAAVDMHEVIERYAGSLTIKALDAGIQLLPTGSMHDGFYYALLQKRVN